VGAETQIYFAEMGGPGTASGKLFMETSYYRETPPPNQQTFPTQVYTTNLISSTDCGATWTNTFTMPNPNEWFYGSVKAERGSHHLAFGGRSYNSNNQEVLSLFTSVDWGATWQKQGASLPGYQPNLAEVTSSTLTYLNMGNAPAGTPILFPWLFTRTSDLGQTFQTLDSTPPTQTLANDVESEAHPLFYQRIDKKVLVVGGRVSYVPASGTASMIGGASALIRYSRDDGATWSQLGMPAGFMTRAQGTTSIGQLVTRPTGEIFASFTSDAVGTATQIGEIQTTADLGKTWRAVTPPPLPNGFSFPTYRMVADGAGNIWILVYGANNPGALAAQMCEIPKGSSACQSIISVPLPASTSGIWDLMVQDDAILISGLTSTGANGHNVDAGFVLRYY
jgi:hypothetical protein